MVVVSDQSSIKTLNLHLPSALARVTVLVLNWNGLHHLQDLLPSLSMTRYANHELVVLDNGSCDGSQNWVR